MIRYFAGLDCRCWPAASCGFHRKKYENPITKDTQQPDKVLFDKAINDIEHGRYEVARLTLNTLINTYDRANIWRRPSWPSPIAGIARAARTAWRRPKRSTRTSSCSIRPWKRRPNRRRRSA